MGIAVECQQCGALVIRAAGHINLALKRGNRVFCDRTCAGRARRKHKTKAQRVEEKRLYDIEYRRKNIDRIKAKKAAYFRATYDPAKAAVERKARMPTHVEYCRQPKYKRWKSAYDKRYRAEKFYGPFAEAAMMTIDLNREVKERMSNHEIRWQNQTANKSQFRSRAAQEEERGRPRHRNRRRDHSAAVG